MAEETVTPETPVTPAEPKGADVKSLATELATLSAEQLTALMAELAPEKKQALLTACAGSMDEAQMSACGYKRMSNEPPKPTETPKPEPNPVTTGGIAMSLTDLAKDPRSKRIADLEAKNIERDLDDLVTSGRITPARAQELKNKLSGTARLSLCLENHGELAPVIQEIEIRRGLKEGTECPITKPTQLSVPERPNHAKVNGVDEKRQKELGEEMAKMA